MNMCIHMYGNIGIHRSIDRNKCTRIHICINININININVNRNTCRHINININRSMRIY